MLDIIELQNEVRLMEIFVMNLTCSCEFIDGRISWVLQGHPRELFLLGMKNKMVEFSLEKMGIENRVKRSRN